MKRFKSNIEWRVLVLRSLDPITKHVGIVVDPTIKEDAAYDYCSAELRGGPCHGERLHQLHISPETAEDLIHVLFELTEHYRTPLYNWAKRKTAQNLWE